MATYRLTEGEHGAYAKTLAADQMDTVIFEADLPAIEVFSDGASSLYVTVDGTTPQIAGSSSWELPAGGPVAKTIVVRERSGADIVVKLVAVGSLKYSVSEPSS